LDLAIREVQLMDRMRALEEFKEREVVEELEFG
jgi:hypothetical protein